MSDELLVFEGVRWPRFLITESSPSSPPTRFYDLAPVGQGRRYQAHGPAGWWRDFAEMDLSDLHPVTNFLHRRGDPAGLLEKAALNAARERLGQPPAEDPKPNTSKWRGLASTLAAIAAAWSEPDTEGVSVIDPARWSGAAKVWRNVLSSVDDPFRWNDAEILPDDAPRVTWLDREIQKISDPEEKRPFVLKARTLSAFMMVSAASSLYRRAQMRRCIRCESWFEFSREHAQFCSVSCRTLAHSTRRT